jgi:hypothetical protein
MIGEAIGNVPLVRGIIRAVYPTKSFAETQVHSSAATGLRILRVEFSHRGDTVPLSAAHKSIVGCSPLSLAVINIRGPPGELLLNSSVATKQEQLLSFNDHDLFLRAGIRSFGGGWGSY